MPLLVILILSSAVGLTAADMENFVEMVIAVQQYFTSGCVYLLHDQNEYLSTVLMTARVGKLMSKKYIQMTLSSLSDYLLNCSHNRPLYVIPDKTRVLQHNATSGAIWLKFLETQSIDEFVSQMDIPFDCEFLIAQPLSDDGYSLIEVFRVHPSLPLQMHRFGNWNLQSGLRKPGIGFYERRSSLRGATIRTAVYKESPLAASEGDVYVLEDFFDQVWDTLRELMDFTPKYLVPTLSVHGTEMENGSWNGIIGIIQRKEADMTCEDLSMSPARAKIVDFMVPIKKDRQYVVVKRTNSFELSWGSFLLPFTSEIWIAIISIIFTMAFMLWIIYLLGCRYWNAKLKGVIVSFYLHDSFFCIFSSFCQQGNAFVPRSASGRIVYLVSYLTAVVLLAGYSASLISYLTLRRPVVPFTTFKGLLQDSSYSFGVLRFSSVFSFFEGTRESVMHLLYRKWLHPRLDDLPTSIPEGLRRLCHFHKYAFMATLDDIDNNSANLSCEVMQVSEAYLPGSRAMATARGSPYLGVFSHYLLKLRSVGILQRLSINASKIKSVTESQFVTMDISSVSPIFAVLAVGVVTAILMLIVEIIVHKWRLRRILRATSQLSYHL